MALEDIKDSLRDQFAGIWARLRDSSAFIELNEKYQALSPGVQKGVLAGTSIFLFLLLMSFPLLYFSASSDLITEYEDKRQLVQDAYHINRAAAAAGTRAYNVITASELETRAQGVVNDAALQAEQRLGVAATTGAKIPGIATSIDQVGVTVTLGKLNLTQIIEIGYRMQTLDPNARLMGVDIKATAADPHYFDVVYRIIGFGPKPEAATGADGKSKRGKGS